MKAIIILIGVVLVGFTASNCHAIDQADEKEPEATDRGLGIDTVSRNSESKAKSFIGRVTDDSMSVGGDEMATDLLLVSEKKKNDDGGRAKKRRGGVKGSGGGTKNHAGKPHRKDGRKGGHRHRRTGKPHKPNKPHKGPLEGKYPRFCPCKRARGPPGVCYEFLRDSKRRCKHRQCTPKYECVGHHKRNGRKRRTVCVRRVTRTKVVPYGRRHGICRRVKTVRTMYYVPYSK